MPIVLGIFEQPLAVARATRRLRGRGHEVIDVYSPVPSHEIDRVLDERPSRVRIYTLIGGLIGVVTGYAMTIWMAYDWPIAIGGKPFASIPPFTIIAFELTILFGGLCTALGLFLVGRLPRLKLDPVYSARFSAEDFGVVVRCRERDVAEVKALLDAQGATEVDLVEA